jgi:hypothetical protein
MDRAAIESKERQLDEEVRARFPGGAVQRVTLMQYGDDPVIEPGELMLRVFIEAADGSEDRAQALEAFQHTHRAVMKEFRRELEERFPEVSRVEFTVEGTEDQPQAGRLVIRIGRPAPHREREAGELTPVMARLGPVDLETLDALITAGIAPNRAEAVRWALARIRERPAYAQLRDRVREIEELKAQF